MMSHFSTCRVAQSPGLVSRCLGGCDHGQTRRTRNRRNHHHHTHTSPSSPLTSHSSHYSHRSRRSRLPCDWRLEQFSVAMAERRSTELREEEVHVKHDTLQELDTLPPVDGPGLLTKPGRRGGLPLLSLPLLGGLPHQGVVYAEDEEGSCSSFAKPSTRKICTTLGRKGRRNREG